MKNKVYLAARYARKVYVYSYTRQISKLGYEVTSGWSEGTEQKDQYGIRIGITGEYAAENSHTPEAEELRNHLARNNLQDIRNCDIFILFTDKDRRLGTTNGRFVEFGYALALDKTCFIVGPRENIFCSINTVRQFDTWEELLAKELMPFSLKGI